MRITYSAAILILATLCSSGMALAEESMHVGVESDDQRLAQPGYDITLSELLDDDGHVVLPKDFSGTVDVEGYILASGPGQPPRFVLSGSADDAWSRDEFSVPGCDLEVRAMAAMAGQLYMGGDFSSCGLIVAEHIVRYTPATGEFSALGSGVNNSVRALAVIGTALYVGGDFSQAGGIAANRIALYDTTASGDAGWSALGSGVNNNVFALAVIGTELYVGGFFTQASGAAANRIAVYDTTASGDVGWSALGSGVNGPVFALAVIGPDLYAGGFFTQAGGAAANRIAVYDTSQTGDAGWSALGSGVNGPVFALVATGSELYVGGQFTQAGGVAASSIAVYDTSQTGDAGWSALGSGVNINSSVLALAVIGTELYVAGDFGLAGGLAANRIAVYDTSQTGDAGWSALGSGVNGTVFALTVIDTALHVGGLFTQAGGVAVNRSAVYDTSATGDAGWSALGSGINDFVFALAVVGTNLYIGGVFTQAGGVAASGIAVYDTSQPGDTGWSALGSGVNSSVFALAVIGTELYVGGQFTQAGGVAARSIAVYDTSQTGDAGWSTLGSGVNTLNGLNNIVSDLAVVGTELYVGGRFTQAGGVAANRIAVYDTNQTGDAGWSTLGSGVDNSVDALAVIGTNLYVGGVFTQAGGIGASGIAVYDTSQSGDAGWSALGSGVNGAVLALAVTDMALYVGGDFTQAGGVAANRIAVYDTSQTGDVGWSALGSGVNNFVFALAVIGTELYVAGDFSQAGGVAANRIAVYDTTATGDVGWSTLGSGVNSGVRALAVNGPALYVGGFFTQAGGFVNGRLARYQTADTFTIGGNVSGLNGTGLVLQNNGGDDLSIAADGSFTFATALVDGSGYAVTVLNQPTGLSQTCSVVSGGMGTLAGANVENVQIECVTNTFTVGGTVTGLAGDGLVLLNNGGDTLTLNEGDPSTFTFATALEDGAMYNVTIDTQPTDLSQTCSVTNGGGTLAGANIENVQIECVTDTFTIGGNVSGLNGTGLVLQNNGGDDLSIAADGSFTFATALVDGSGYAVTVLNQPTGPSQTCSVTNGGGTLAGANVENVQIECVTNTFTVGGTVVGLAGDGLVLLNNGGDALTLNEGDPKIFTFATLLDDGTSYSVTIQTQPTSPNQTCTVSNGAGTLSGADVTDVQVTCVTDQFTVGGTVSGLNGTGLVLQNNGGDDLSVTADGAFTFATPLDDGSEYEVTVLTQPTAARNQECMVSNGSGTLAGADVTDIAVNCDDIMLGLSTSDLDLGVVLIDMSGTGTIVVTNTGTPDLTLDGISSPA
ncbi:MAG: hypothetical protein AAF446_02510, partial [Pseudomonadota bacterium]